MTPADILARLAEIARLIESHKACVFQLKQERADLQGRLRASGWTGPEVQHGG